LSPLATAIAGALLLNESLSRPQAVSGGTFVDILRFFHQSTLALTLESSVVFSLIGVVLIARPTFIFGSNSLPSTGNGPDIEKGTPAERLVAVGYDYIYYYALRT
jgi:hypothetical protein